MSNYQAITSVVNRDDLGSLFLNNNEHNQSKLVPIVDHIESIARSMVFDISTDEGKKGVRSLAANIAKAKTAIDNAGKDLKAELSVDIKIIDGLRNMSKGKLQELQDEIRQPLTELENKEKERKAAIEVRLEWLSSAGNAAMNSDQLLELIASITSQPIDDSWDEYKADAIEAHESTLTRLNATYQQVKQAENDKAELEALRAEAAESRKREAERQAADQARAEAEAKAKRQAQLMQQEHQRHLDLAAEAIEKANAEHQKQLDEQARKAEHDRKKLEDDKNRELFEARNEITLAQRKADEARRKELQAIAEQQRIEAEEKAAAELKIEQERLEVEKRKADKALQDQAITDSIEDLISSGIPKTHAKRVIELIFTEKVVNVSFSF